MRHDIRLRLAVVSMGAAMLLALAGCDFGSATPTPVVGPTGTPQVGETATAGPTEAVRTPQAGVTPAARNAMRFADYKIEPSSVTPAVLPYTVEPGLANVANAKLFDLPDRTKALIEKNAFAAQFPQGEQYRQFYQLYEDGRYEQQPVFVTTDSLLHVYHLMFDKILRNTETKYLIDHLKGLNAAMLAESQTQYGTLKGTSAENAAKRNVAFFTVASRLLDPNAPIPRDVQPEVLQELKLIDEHAGLSESAVMNIGATEADFREDYGQYKPRGHYTRSEDLSKYFKAMMWYGRITFRLDNVDETRSSILMVQALNNAKTADGTPAAEKWANIYDPTVFFVGEADDLTYRDYSPLMAQVFGEGADAKAAADDAKVEQFRQTAQKTLAGPRINSMFVFITEDKEQVTKGLRMMGQRFTLDEYVFGQLIWREVGTLDEPRWLPKGLDVPAAFGSEEAYTILKDMGESKYANYDTQMTKVRGQVASLPTSQWTENLYWSWLYAFQPLLKPKSVDSGYPSFMTNDAWTRKDLNTVLGSWTELKHDTLLYAKQVMAEAGGGPPEITKGYVEPEPEFYARIAALVGMTRDGLLARGLLEKPEGEKDSPDYRTLQDLQDLALDLKRISEKELENKELSEDEYQLIKYYGGRLESITNMAAENADPSQPYGGDLNDQDAAVVADVATGESSVLTEGTGRIMEVYVVYPVGDKLFLGRGGIYSQYEFVQPTGNRLTDEQWRQRLEQGQVPELGDWKTYVSK